MKHSTITAQETYAPRSMLTYFYQDTDVAHLESQGAVTESTMQIMQDIFPNTRKNAAVLGYGESF